MNIKRAKDEIKNTVRAYLQKDDFGEYLIPENRQRPMLLIGPPGIGKTQIMQEVARECQIGLVAYTITHHTRQSAVGLPFIKEENFGGKHYSVTEYTMSEIISSIHRYMKETGKTEGILFIDEINCVSETLAPTMLQFLQCKTFGNQAVPRGWIITAAGNPPEYNKSVRDFDFVTLDRVRKMDIDADLPVFLEYARQVGIHPFILSYLELRPQNFYKAENDVDGMQFVTARGWEDLSCLIQTYEKLDIAIDEEVIHQYLQHEDVAMDVAAYYDLYQKYKDQYNIPAILQGKVQTDVFSRLFQASFDERLSCVTLLADGLITTLTQATHIDRLTTDAFTHLKNYRMQLLSPENTASPLELYQRSLDAAFSRLKAEEKTGLFTTGEKSYQKELLSLLTSWKSSINSCDAETAFEQLRLSFMDQTKLREKTIQSASSSLEYAFTFMEDAFMQGEKSQEMVIFITELTLNPHAVSFITENGCDRYFQYNKSLLIGSRRRNILNALSRDDIQKNAMEHAF